VCARSRFNPHSPLLANELRICEAEEPGISGVSIHIRHCWRMNYTALQSLRSAQHVSIHIRHCWRMNCRCRSASGGLKGFNPHSPLLANELYATMIALLLCMLFQSTFAIAGE